MTCKIALYFTHSLLYHLNINWLIAIIFVFALSIYPAGSLAQDSFNLEEISVTLIVQEIGTVEVPALISENEEVYLPIKDVFDYLIIKNNISAGIDTITGFFIKPEEIFLIDNVSKRIHYQDKVIILKPDDLIRSETNLYLKINFFGDVFGLMCTFNFRTLSVNLNTQIELPAIRDMRLKKMRENILDLVGESKADTIIRKDFKYLNIGMADWAIYNTNYLKNKINLTRANLSLGGIVLGGETQANLNYPFGQSLNKKHLTYSWRYVDNENHILRQIRAGHVYSPTTSQLYSPIIGLQLTNTPTTFRRSFGYHTLSDYTEPGWIVEIYINNVLVDYVKADDSGFYTFEVPILYGNTDLKLRFYGPWGEEYSSSQNINIPYTFLPPQEFTYTTTAGLLRDSKNNLFARSNMDYGISRYFTIGGGLEYLKTQNSQNIIPLLKTSISLPSNLIFFGEFSPGVKSNAILSYRIPSALQIELDYTIYNKDQKVINISTLEQRQITLSLPIRLGNINLYSRFHINQTIFPSSKFTTANLLFTGSFYGVNTNLTTNAWFYDYTDPQLFSNLVISFSLPARFNIRPQAQYDYNRKKISLIRLAIEKQLFDKININAFFEKNFIFDYSNFQAGLRYEFPFAQTSTSVSASNSQTTLFHSANGSFMYDANTDYFAGNIRPSVGKSGIVLLSYLDINANGHRDLNEPKVSGLDVRINGGRVESSERDTTIRIYDLEPYRDYFVELRSTGFDYIAWQIRNSNIRVNINANQFKLIEIPISVLGEVSGTVYLNKVGYDSGQERILVNIYNSNSNLVSSVISEEDGYFSYLGLKPGSYSARIDTKQLNDLQMTSIPDELSFEILPTIEGDYADGLEFVLENKKDEYLEDEHKIELKEAIANETVSEEDNENEVSPAQTSEVKESEFDKNGKRFLVLSGSANFKIGRTELQPNPKTGLDRLIGFMEDNPQTYWVIEGHTDDRGNSRQNYRLSLARAKSVLNYFVQNGIDADRFEIIAFGKSRPIADNSKSFGRALNRRVVIQEMGHYKQREGSTPGFSSINYDYENEYNIEGMIFTDNRYYCRQVSAWKTRRKAASEVEKLKAKGHSAFIKIYNSPENKRWYRVRIGYFDNLEAARESSNIIDRKIRRVAALNSINYDYKNEFNIESFIFTDNQYYCIQVSSLKNRNKAAAEVEKLKSKGHSAFIETYDSPENIRWFRVRIGYFKNLEGAREYLKLIP